MKIMYPMWKCDIPGCGESSFAPMAHITFPAEYDITEADICLSCIRKMRDIISIPSQSQEAPAEVITSAPAEAETPIQCASPSDAPELLEEPVPLVEVPSEPDCLLDYCIGESRPIAESAPSPLPEEEPEEDSGFGAYDDRIMGILMECGPCKGSDIIVKLDAANDQYNVRQTLRRLTDRGEIVKDGYKYMLPCDRKR